jgi:cobalt/nickel transport system ATP-binding protein
MMELQNVSFGYRPGESTLKGVDLKIEIGSCLALIGANGSGKSTLLMLLNGLLRPTQGQIFWSGRPVDYHQKGLKELRKHVGFVFQNPDHQLVAPTVEQDLAFGPLNLGRSSKETRGQVERIAGEFGISHLLQQPVSRLSFGQKKLVSLAGVIVMEPDLLVLDEPTLGLDVDHQGRLEAFLKGFQTRGKTIVYSTHDWDFLAKTADQVGVLNHGSVVERGDPWRILSGDQRLIEVGLRPYPVGQVSQALGLKTLDQSVILKTLVRSIRESSKVFLRDLRHRSGRR